MQLDPRRFPCISLKVIYFSNLNQILSTNSLHLLRSATLKSIVCLAPVLDFHPPVFHNATSTGEEILLILPLSVRLGGSENWSDTWENTCLTKDNVTSIHIDPFTITSWKPYRNILQGLVWEGWVISHLHGTGRCPTVPYLVISLLGIRKGCRGKQQTKWEILTMQTDGRERVLRETANRKRLSDARSNHCWGIRSRKENADNAAWIFRRNESGCRTAHRACKIQGGSSQTLSVKT